MRPSTTSKRSVWIGWTWGIGTAPPGRSPSSKASSSPSVVAAVSVKVKRSPVTGFSSVCPGLIMERSQPGNSETVHGSNARNSCAIVYDEGMDAVAGLLDGPRARDAFLLRSSMDPPWSLRIEDEAPLTVVAVVRGEAWFIPDDGEAEPLRRGDVAIVRGPEPYTVADDPGYPAAGDHPAGPACA